MQPEIGSSLEALDTPSIIIDLDLMEANLANLTAQLKPTGVNFRPHLKTVKSGELAQRMLKAGAIGGCVAKLGEAEVMAENGLRDLLLTTELVGKPKLDRLVRLLQNYGDLRLKLVVDSVEGATALNQALEEAGLRVEVLIDLNVGQHRTGVASMEAALELARSLLNLPALRLIGLQGYEGHVQHVANPAEREQLCHQAMRILTDTARLLRQNHFTIETVTTGGTGTALLCAAYPGITEVQPGSFIFMDTDYFDALGPRYANSLTILATVISRPAPTRAVLDAGLKSLSTDSGFARLKDFAGLTYRPGGDEHGILEWDSQANPQINLSIGDRIELIPSHIDTTINLHDYYFACRANRLEAIWPISARGKIQ